MSRNFEFNAPQFINFANLDDLEADSFFDTGPQVEQENKKSIINGPCKQEESKIKSDTKNKEINPLIEVNNSNGQKKNQVLRKVLHDMVNQNIQYDSNNPMPVETPNTKSERELLQKLENLCLSESKSVRLKIPSVHTTLNESTLTKSSRKSHCMITRLDALTNRCETQTQPSETVTSTETKEQLNISATKPVTRKTKGPSRELFKTMKRQGSPISNSKKFISLAEQVEHFHKHTPERFRSKPPKNEGPPKTTCAIKTFAVVPKTPNLTTKYRQRKINFPDEKQREEMEIEEMKKHQVKAYPLNEKILQGPSLNLKMPVIKKPATVPQPFSLTEVKKKQPHEEPVFHFKAQPVPVSILQRPVGIPPRKTLAPTVPMTPTIRVPMRLRVEVKTPERTPSTDSLNHPRNTKVEPFSFDTKIKETMQKKQEFIGKVLEEEKKMFNSFKAHPMPRFRNNADVSIKLNRYTPHKTIPKPFNLTESEKPSQEPDSNGMKVTPFKARPAKVVHQEPFIPKLEKRNIALPSEFHLNTEKRALERQKFDEKIKQKEEEMREDLKLLMEEEEKKEKELALLERKKTEFKAKPMPRYKPFEIHGSDPEKLTLPQSPKFATKQRDAKKAKDGLESC